MLEVGMPFPNFSLPNQDDQMMKLSDFAGKWLLLWVYPKDDTPGCTLEGKGFSAAKPQFDQVGAIAVGISEDDTASHKRFCEKYGFGVPLLADTSKQFLKTMGVTQKEWNGTMYWNRTSFLVDPKGVLRKVYENVKPDGHEKEVLADIQAMSRR